MAAHGSPKKCTTDSTRLKASWRESARPAATTLGHESGPSFSNWRPARRSHSDFRITIKNAADQATAFGRTKKPSRVSGALIGDCFSETYDREGYLVEAIVPDELV